MRYPAGNQRVTGNVFVGCVIFFGILQGLKEGLFAALDAIPDFRKIAAFED